jgi:hypothetical protein
VHVAELQKFPSIEYIYIADRVFTGNYKILNMKLEIMLLKSYKIFKIISHFAIIACIKYNINSVTVQMV